MNKKSELEEIIINGARENNLKNVNIVIPREKLVVITGVSGSGKSSLAFDTIYAEGQRRYMQCLSSYAKQFMGELKKPDVDSIEGLSPAISIEQKTISRTPRSTVGTVTEIYDYIRLLFSKIGTQYCVDCNVPVIKKDIDQIVKEIYDEFNNQSVLILSPLVIGRKGHYRELFNKLILGGFSRVRIDGKIVRLVQNMQVERYKIHDIELVVDKCLVSEDNISRIKASADVALLHGDGSILILDESNIDNLHYFSVNNSCPVCKKSYKVLVPNMFSFNSPYGACPTCHGLGEIEEFDLDLLIPDKNKTIFESSIPFLGIYKSVWSKLKNFAEIEKIDISKPVNQIPKDQFNVLMYGNMDNDEYEEHRRYEGIINSLSSIYNCTAGQDRKELDIYRIHDICPTCHGHRLKRESSAVKIQNYTIDDIVNLDIENCIKVFENIENNLSKREEKITGLIIKEIKQRLSFLYNVGLSYISLSRNMSTLSGGESQRIRLASQIGSQLVGITYVLDEPSIGLHPRDNDRLINMLKRLRDVGNTVIVVEHDKSMIKSADYIVDFGPGAGISGGEVIFATEADQMDNLNKKQLEASYTAQYIKGIKKIEPPKKIRKPNKNKQLELIGASGNNLKNIDLKIPLGLFVCITGVSGSGKSSLINDTLYPLLSNILQSANKKPLKYENIYGIKYIDKVIEVDQIPIGRLPRSNPATYTKIFDIIRAYYAKLPESIIRGYKDGRFSFNVPGGRCEACKGAGLKKLEMNFLPDIYVPCDVCNGKRYNKETLQIKYNGKSIYEVLEMTVSEALKFFDNIPKLKDKLAILNDVGLGYIKLGQQATTLSGGEAQRVKLATELSKPDTSNTVFLLDEPTTGLHFEDIRLLLIMIQKLVDKGNTVIVVEHNLDIIKSADWIIDMGPDSGANGGYIIAEGSPYDIAKNKNSVTGQYIARELLK